MTCECQIIPKDVLDRFAKDKSLSEAQRKHFAAAAAFDSRWRKARTAIGKASAAAENLLPNDFQSLTPPLNLIFDCNHGTSLPGTPVNNPGTQPAGPARRAFDETKKAVEFYQTVFGRNSVDNNGKTLMSSVHFSTNYNNAGWTGTQMRYGDGDGNIFIDFTKSDDVIGHELTHGVTQYSGQYAYSNQAGGLNESMSDVFGSMFRQWKANQTVNQADWLIGSAIMGPGSAAKGFTCLRDMANPAAKHCLAPQPTNFSQYHDGMDPHYASGPPNLAFYKAAKAYGGKSWDKVGQIWYKALTGYAPAPNLKMLAFANRTRIKAKQLYPGDAALYNAVDLAWKAVGL